MSSRPIRLVLGFLTVGFWTLASRILGFVREVMIVSFLGSGPVAEAFFVAFRLPNMFRRFFAEGALNTAFVPLFAKTLEADGEDAARRFGQEAFSSLFVVLITLTLLAQLVMPWLVYALASGFADTGRFELTITFARILFPYILFISLAALLSGILNSFGRFAAAAAAPILLNIILVAAMLLAWLLEYPIGFALVWGAALAGLAQFGLVWWAARQLGMGLLPGRPRLTPKVKRLIIIGGPALLAGGVLQINLLVGTQVASYFEGAVVWLAVADRIYQLPLGLVGVAIGVVLLPELSRRHRAGDSPGTRDSMNRAAEFSSALILPATVGLLVVPVLVTSVLFERGAFTPVDTLNTAQALMIYAIGLPAFVLQKVLQPAYFAREDTKTPLNFALVSMLVNLVVAIGLAPLVGFIAAAIATTLAAWVNLVLLMRGLRELDDDLTLDSGLRHRLPRIFIASIAMGALVLGICEMLQNFVSTHPVISLVGIVVFAVTAYGCIVVWLGGLRVQDLRSAIRRTRR
ncbi:MAG: murein biosynthesis integral membrane protein MurJ [Pseudomonadota bacterium]